MCEGQGTAAWACAVKICLLSISSLWQVNSEDIKPKNTEVICVVYAMLYPKLLQ